MAGGGERRAGPCAAAGPAQGLSWEPVPVGPWRGQAAEMVAGSEAPVHLPPHPQAPTRADEEAVGPAPRQPGLEGN